MGVWFCVISNDVIYIYLFSTHQCTINLQMDSDSSRCSLCSKKLKLSSFVRESCFSNSKNYVSNGTH